MPGFRRILHALDFTPASRPAFVKAVELAAASRAKLLLLHVLDVPRPWVASGATTRVYRQVLEQDRRAALRRLEALVARAKTKRVGAVALVVAGDPRTQIVATAKAQRADLIVVGTRSSEGMERILLGSVARRVLEAASCPVLTVPRR